jgi:hypothetical protein
MSAVSLNFNPVMVTPEIGDALVAFIEINVSRLTATKVVLVGGGPVLVLFGPSVLCDVIGAVTEFIVRYVQAASAQPFSVATQFTQYQLVRE